MSTEDLNKWNNTALLYKSRIEGTDPYYGKATIAGIDYTIRGWIREGTEKSPSSKYILMHFKVKKDATFVEPKRGSA